MKTAFQSKLFSCCIFGLLSLTSHAQQSRAIQIKHYQEQIGNYANITASWHTLELCQLLIVVAVICFGATITILQGVSGGWAKPTTLILGAAVTILTGIGAKVFDADYWVYAKAVIDGKDLIDQMQTIVDSLSDPAIDLASTQSQWLKLKTDFSGLQKSVLEGKNNQASILIESEVVYAQASAPAWFTPPPPADQSNLYYVGSAEGTSLSDVGTRSFNAAVLAGAKSLTKTGMSVDSLSPVITTAATVEKSYFSFNKTRGMYTYYTLIRITNDAQHLQISAPPANSKTIKVPGNNEWTDTGIVVAKGNALSISASGVVQWNYGNSTDPEGSLWKAKPHAFRPRYQVADIGAGGLIGKIGNSGKPFRVGKDLKVIAPVDGKLYLGINDNSYKDNAGAFTASVGLKAP